MTSYAAISFDVSPSGGVVAARPRTRAASAPLAGLGGQVRPATARRTDVLVPAPGATPGGPPV